MIRTIPKLLVEDNLFCPGCGHGIANRLLAEVFEELGIEEEAIAVLAVGCACLQIDTFGVDSIQAIHGRAPATATAIKRCRPNNPVFAYQGDGDALAIGMAETIHAAARNENITVVFINNGVFGMTGGQMAPTSLSGQVTSSSVHGRDDRTMGKPMNIINVLKALDVSYLARGTLTSPNEIKRTKGFLKKAFENQMNNLGYSFVEILSPCPTNWKLTPLDAMERIKDEVLPLYPVEEFIKEGVSKDD